MTQSTNKKPLSDKDFVKIPRIWIDDLMAERLTSQELFALFWLFLRANKITGKVVVNYKIISIEFEDLLSSYKDKINQATKIMLALKKKKRLWFPKHVGSRSKVEVELHKYPLVTGEYTDVSRRFQQNDDRGSNDDELKKGLTSAELCDNGQRSRSNNQQSNKGQNNTYQGTTSRTPKTDDIDIRQIDIAKDKKASGSDIPNVDYSKRRNKTLEELKKTNPAYYEANKHKLEKE